MIVIVISQLSNHCKFFCYSILVLRSQNGTSASITGTKVNIFHETEQTLTSPFKPICITKVSSMKIHPALTHFAYPRQALGKPFAYPRHTLRKSKQTLWACLGFAKGERRTREGRALIKNSTLMIKSQQRRPQF